MKAPQPLIQLQTAPNNVWTRLTRGAQRVQARSDWQTLHPVNWPSEIMERSVTDHLCEKQNRSTGRLILSMNEKNLSVYLKRHFKESRWHGILALFWPQRGWSNAWTEAQAIARLQTHKIPVPAVVAEGEFIGPWGKLSSFLAIEELSDMLPLSEAIPLAASRLDMEVFVKWKNGLIHELASISSQLHSLSLFHKDFYLCHFFIPENYTRQLPDTWLQKIYIIDLHRLRKHRWLKLKWQAKDLGQLLFSSELAEINNNDRIQFLKLYQSLLSIGYSKRVLLKALIAIKSKLYRRHNREKPDTVSQLPKIQL